VISVENWVTIRNLKKKRPDLDERSKKIARMFLLEKKTGRTSDKN
jgi:hypothetical protein